MSKSQATDVALPDGADPEHTDNWETDNGVTCRLIWSTPEPLPKRLADCDIRVVASQRPDGTIITDDPKEEPLVYFFGSDYIPTDARTLAQALLNAAGLAEKWAQR